MGRVKKIVLTVTNDLTYDQRMQKICSSLVKGGYSVELVGRQRPTSIPLKEVTYKQTRLICYFDKGKLFYAEYNLRLLLYLLFTGFDAVCAIDLDTLVPAYIIAKFKRNKLIYDAHEYFTEVPEVTSRPIVKKIWQWVERKFMPGCDLVYTVSPGLAHLYKEKYNVNAAVILNVPLLNYRSNHGNPNINPCNPNPNPGNPNTGYLLYQGALNEGRGLEALIEAMQQLNAKLKIAGEGDLSASLRALSAKLNLEDKVEFLGYVEPGDLRELTRGAAIGFNLLELKGLSYYNSLSNKFFDYIHAGVPQVCIDFPAYREINSRYEVAVLIDDCSPPKICEAVNRLLQMPELYQTLKKNCEVCSRTLNWEEEEKKLLGLYDQLF